MGDNTFSAAIALSILFSGKMEKIAAPIEGYDISAEDIAAGRAFQAEITLEGENGETWDVWAIVAYGEFGELQIDLMWGEGEWEVYTWAAQ